MEPNEKEINLEDFFSDHNDFSNPEFKESSTYSNYIREESIKMNLKENHGPEEIVQWIANTESLYDHAMQIVSKKRHIDDLNLLTTWKDLIHDACYYADIKYDRLDKEETVELLANYFEDDWYEYHDEVKPDELIGEQYEDSMRESEKKKSKIKYKKPASGMKVKNNVGFIKTKKPKISEEAEYKARMKRIGSLEDTDDADDFGVGEDKQHSKKYKKPKASYSHKKEDLHSRNNTREWVDDEEELFAQVEHEFLHDDMSGADDGFDDERDVEMHMSKSHKRPIFATQRESFEDKINKIENNLKESKLTKDQKLVKAVDKLEEKVQAIYALLKPSK